MKNRLFFSAMLVSLLAFGLTLTSCGPSAATQAMLATSSINDVSGFGNKLTWLKSNAQSGGSYVIEIDRNIVKFGGPCAGLFATCGNLSYKDKDNITITIKNVGENSTIIREEPGSVFSVGSGVTLILEGNITLQGPTNIRPLEYNKTKSLVNVSSGGTFIMNEGSAITGGMYMGSHMCDGGGVHVSSGGTFIMKGGTISRNVSFPIPDAALASASKGKATNWTKVECKGGGVYVSGKSSLFGKESPSGTFTKTGGTITGYASDPENGNVIRDFNGNNVVPNMGHAIYFGGKEKKSIDTTVGPEMSFNFSNDKFSEILNEEQPAPSNVPTEIQTEDAP